MAESVLSVEHLTKEYRTNFRRKLVRAVVDASFDVKPNEIFGFVGPNGAGKTTTIRSLMGLIRPARGAAPSSATRCPAGRRGRVSAFSPSSPYFYDDLTPRELLDLCGRLFGMDAAARQKRAALLIDKVGLTVAADRPLKKFSKGMLQRAGLAQALMNDPELVVLDEPMSGLDPAGRKEVRDIMLELRDAGKTVFFSTHILPDVEAICDRVAIISQGKVQHVGPVAALLDESLAGTEIVLRGGEVALAGAKLRRNGDETTVMLPPDADVNAALVQLAAAARVVSVTPRRESLEDLFMRKTRGAPPA